MTSTRHPEPNTAASAAPSIGSSFTQLSDTEPAIAPSSRGDDLLDAAVRENVPRAVARLRSCDPVLREPLRAGNLKIVGGRYDLDDGNVEFLES